MNVLDVKNKAQTIMHPVPDTYWVTGNGNKNGRTYLGICSMILWIIPLGVFYLNVINNCGIISLSGTHPRDLFTEFL
jgi:hypothetical protein